MYELIHRLLMAGLLLSCTLLYFIIRKRLSKKKWIHVGYWLIGVIFCYTISGIPFENLFIGFETPEQAFAYRIGNKEITYKYEGEKACWLVYKDKEGESTEEAFFKTDKGWALAPWPVKTTGSKIISSPSQDRYGVLLSRIRNTDQIFVEVINLQEKSTANLKINDGTQEPFRIRIEGEGIGKKISYNKIMSLEKGKTYKMYVNGDEITYTKK